MSVNKFTPGDIVIGYHKGYWKVVSTNNHIVNYQRIDAKCKILKSCDGAYCTKIDPEAWYQKQVEAASKIFELMLRAQDD